MNLAVMFTSGLVVALLPAQMGCQPGCAGPTGPDTVDVALPCDRVDRPTMQVNGPCSLAYEPDGITPYLGSDQAGRCTVTARYPDAISYAATVDFVEKPIACGSDFEPDRAIGADGNYVPLPLGPQGCVPDAGVADVSPGDAAADAGATP